MMSDDHKAKLLLLCDLVSSGRADQAQVDELEAIMLEDEAARQIFLDWSALQVDLAAIIQASQSREGLLERIDQQTAKSVRSRYWMAGLSVLAASLLLVLYAVRSGQENVNPQVPSDGERLIAAWDSQAESVIDGMAIVNRVYSPVWSTSATPVAAGDLLRASRWIELESGVAEVQFGQGAVVVLEGPARFAAKSTSLGVLDYGKLAAVVPPWAEGFQIDTPAVEVVDRGTEFVVEVSRDKQVTVGVTKGEVEVFKQGLTETANEAKSMQRLFAGNALRATDTDFNTTVLDKSWHSLSSQLPKRPDHTQVEVVAKYRRDYLTGVSNRPSRESNWRYYANYWSLYNDPEGYRELLWDSQREVYDPNGDVGWTAGGRLGVSNFSYRGGHPGEGRDQSKDDIDHYVIAAFQVTKPGRYRIESGWLVRAESRDDLANQAVDLRAWVNSKSDAIEETCNHDGLLQFQGDVGWLKKDDWIYVAVGPRDVAYNDRFEWDFAIVRTIEDFTF